MEETEYQEKTTDLLQVTDERYHIMLYQVHLVMSEIQTCNFGGELCNQHYKAMHLIYVLADGQDGN